MSDKSHILVTAKGHQIQRQILKETLSDFPLIKSPKRHSKATPYKPNLTHTSFTSTSFSSSSLPRSGYFGPRELRTPSPVGSPKPYNLYPNYLNKEAKECPPRHFCPLKPKTISKGIKEPSPEVAKGKYVHHTLYNLAMNSKLADNPSMYGLNFITFEKEDQNPFKARTEEVAEDWSEIESMKKSMKKIQKKLEKSKTQSFSQTKMNMNSSYQMRSTVSSRFGSTAGLTFSKFGSTMGSRFMSPSRDLETKEEKFLSRYMENQQKFEELLVRFNEEKIRKMKRHEENQHEAPEFIEKLKEIHHSVESVETKRLNEDARNIKRLKEYHKRKFVAMWGKHGQKEDNEGKGPERPLGLKGGPLYNVTAHNFNPRRNIHSRNSSFSLKDKNVKIGKITEKDETISRIDEPIDGLRSEVKIGSQSIY